MSEFLVEVAQRVGWVLLVVGIITCVALAVNAAVDRTRRRRGPRKDSSSTEHFVMRPMRHSATVAIIAVVTVAIVLAIYSIGREFTVDRVVYYAVLIAVCCTVALAALGMVPGVWETRVDGDDICLVRLWVFRRHYSFSQIEYVLIGHGMECYVAGRKRPAIRVSIWTTNYEPFRKRLMAEGISFRDMETHKTVPPSDLR
jgi:hypothetical protein